MIRLIVLSVLCATSYANNFSLDKEIEVVMQVDTENNHDLWAGRKRSKEKRGRRRGGSGLR